MSEDFLIVPSLLSPPLFGGGNSKPFCGLARGGKIGGIARVLNSGSPCWVQENLISANLLAIHSTPSSKGSFPIRKFPFPPYPILRRRPFFPRNQIPRGKFPSSSSSRLTAFHAASLPPTPSLGDRDGEGGKKHKRIKWLHNRDAIGHPPFSYARSYCTF